MSIQLRVRAALSRIKMRAMMVLPRRRDPAAVFSSIYRNKIWAAGAAKGSDFYSGVGSTEAFTEPYERLIAQFIKDNNIRVVVDLGCGDFQVGQRILQKVECTYVGVDVVDDLIARNNARFGSEKVSFYSRDISHDPLPDGDLCLIRQVLQHLDNATIERVLQNAQKYKFCIVTESQRFNPKVINVDIPSGAWTRSSLDSGLYFDQKPFSRKIQTLLTVQRNAEGAIHTCLLSQ